MNDHLSSARPPSVGANAADTCTQTGHEDRCWRRIARVEIGACQKKNTCIGIFHSTTTFSTPSINSRARTAFVSEIKSVTRNTIELRRLLTFVQTAFEDFEQLNDAPAVTHVPSTDQLKIRNKAAIVMTSTIQVCGNKSKIISYGGAALFWGDNGSECCCWRRYTEIDFRVPWGSRCFAVRYHVALVSCT